MLGWDPGGGKAGGQAEEEAEGVDQDIGLGIHAEHEEEEGAAGETGNDPAGGAETVFPEDGEVGGEHAEGGHDHTGSAEADVVAGPEDGCDGIGEGAGGEGGSGGETGAVAAHGEAHEEATEDGIHGEVAEVGMEPGGGEGAPPFAGFEGAGLEQGVVGRGRAQSVEQGHEGDPDEGGPVELEGPFFAEGIETEGPSPVFLEKLPQRVPRPSFVLRPHPQHPASGGTFLFDSHLNLLTGQGQAPIHGPSFRPGRDQHGGLGGRLAHAGDVR